MGYRDITFKSCGVHEEILFACERCPVCVAIEERDKAFAAKDETIATLEGVVYDLEGRVDDYRRELGL